jgi:hypothetical protein
MLASNPRIRVAITLLATALTTGFWYLHRHAERDATAQPARPPAAMESHPAAPERRIIDPQHVDPARRATSLRPISTPPPISTRPDFQRRSLPRQGADDPCASALGRWRVSESIDIQLMARGVGSRGGTGNTVVRFQWTCSGNGDIRLELPGATYRGRHEPPQDALLLVDAAGNEVRATRAD